MKNISIFIGAILILFTAGLQGQYMSVGNNDFIGFGNYPPEPYILEAENNHFYMITGSNYDSPAHTLLGNIYNDFAAVILMKYDPSGKPLWENHIYGGSYFHNVVMQDDNLVLFSSSNTNVEIEPDILIPIKEGAKLEYLVKYDKDGNYLKHASIWTPTQASPSSDNMTINPVDGSIFVYGWFANGTLTLENATTLGSDWPNGFMYVIKYSKDLEFEWAFTTGFIEVGGYAYYNKIVGIPDVQGNLLLTGTYASNSGIPVFGDDQLSYLPDSHGLFAYKLSAKGEPMWAKQGSLYGYTYDGFGVYEGFGMSNGDLILAAITITGRFQLSDADVIFKNYNGMENHLVMRMDPDGNMVWVRPIQSMGYPSTEKKSASKIIEEPSDTKGIQSDQIGFDIFHDALLLKEDKIYILGTTASDSMTVAGEKLPNIFGEAMFVASLNADDGSENWGHTVSSNYIHMSGFGIDRYGNAVVSGYSGNIVNIKGIGDREITSFGEEIQYLHGVSHNGDPLWFNGVYLQSNAEGLLSTDIEILDNGTPVASFYIEQADYVILGDQSFIRDFIYGNYLFMLEAPNLVTGYAKTVDGSTVYPGWVKAIYEADNGQYPVVDSMELGDDGSFQFSNLQPGSYTFRVEANQDNYPEGKPTYLGDQISWQDASFIIVNASDTLIDQNIMLVEIPPFTADDGSGQVLGNVSYNDGNKKSTLGRPIKNASVVLVSKTAKSTLETIVAVIQTDDLGNYFFNNVPDDSYVMHVDIPGLDMVRTYNVTIVGDVIYSGLDFVVDEETGIDIIWGVGVDYKPVNTVKIYPNPGNGKVYIENSSDTELYITVYSIDARMLMSTRINLELGDNLLDISKLNPGIYFIKVESRTGNSITKYVIE